jgi:hypothetical protein
MMKAMSELFTKNQQPTDTTLEWVERSIARIIDQVDGLETGLPLMDQDKLADHSDEEEVEDEELFHPPHPPPWRQHHDDQQVHQVLPRPPRRPNWQAMEGHPHHGPNQ